MVKRVAVVLRMVAESSQQKSMVKKMPLLGSEPQDVAAVFAFKKALPSTEKYTRMARHIRASSLNSDRSRKLLKG